MSERVCNVVAVAVIGLSLAVVIGALAASPPSDTDRVHALAARLKCPVCASESIADSPAELSRNLLDLIAEQVADGWSDEEIVEFFISRYGTEVLLDPAPGGTAVVLWLLPVLVAGVGIALIVGRRRRDLEMPLDEASRKTIAIALEERERR